MDVYAAILFVILSLPTGESLEARPVAAFSNVCALTVERINDFLNCTLTRALIDNRERIVIDFKKQTSSFGELSMGEVVRMMCRSLGNDGHAGMNSYVESLESEEDQEYMLGNLKLCGGPDLTGF